MEMTYETPRMIKLEDSGVVLVNFTPDNPEWLVDSYLLSRLLGYRGRTALRDQILRPRRWGNKFSEGVHYHMLHDSRRLNAYKRLYELALGPEPGKPVKAERGRMLLSSEGWNLALDLTSKSIPDALENLRRFDPSALTDAQLRAVTTDPGTPSAAAPDASRTAAEVQTPPDASPRPGALEEPSRAATDAPRSSASISGATDVRELDRRHAVMENLVGHMMTTKDLAIRELAIMSAEAALDRQLTRIREIFLRRSPRTRAQSLSRTTRQAELQTLEDSPLDSGRFYRLTEIGRHAGGYSASQAGKAADRVAAKMGLTHDDIRVRQQPFNKLGREINPQTGKMRRTWEFDRRFANAVVRELRSSPEVSPEPPLSLEPFHLGGDDLPDLSRGPLEEDLS